MGGIKEKFMAEQSDLSPVDGTQTNTMNLLLYDPSYFKVAWGQTTGVTPLVGQPILIEATIATGDKGDFKISDAMPFTMVVTDFWVVMATAAGGTAGQSAQLKGTAAITDAVSLDAAADTTVARAGTIDDATHEVQAGGDLIVTTAATGDTHNGFIAYVLGFRAVSTA